MLLPYLTACVLVPMTWQEKKMHQTFPSVGGKSLTCHFIISSHHNDTSARPYFTKWIHSGLEMRKSHPWSQSVVLLQLRNPAGWYHSYFIPGKDYLSGPWEMYWSVFLFPPAITWQRHLGGEWMSDAWCVWSSLLGSGVQWRAERGWGRAAMMQP